MKSEQTRPASGAGEKRPARYRLYDRIRDHVSLNVVNGVIIFSALAIIALLVIGILTSDP